MDQVMNDAVDFSCLSDVFKDAYGYRPDVDYMKWFAALDIASQKQEWDFLNDRIVESINKDSARETAQKAKWETHIAKLMADNNVDQATALRWDMDAIGAQMGGYRDAGYYCFLWGIAYSIANEIRALVPEVQIPEF
jgi:hypothetical protein